jgi:hypothetical protein
MTFKLFKKAESAIAVTDAGNVRIPAGPVYPVTVVFVPSEYVRLEGSAGIFVALVFPVNASAATL